MHTIKSSTATPGPPDVYFTPPDVIDVLRAASHDVLAAEAPHPCDSILGNPPFGAGQLANA